MILFKCRECGCTIGDWGCDWECKYDALGLDERAPGTVTKVTYRLEVVKEEVV